MAHIMRAILLAMPIAAFIQYPDGPLQFLRAFVDEAPHGFVGMNARANNLYPPTFADDEFTLLRKVSKEPPSLLEA